MTVERNALFGLLLTLSVICIVIWINLSGVKQTAQITEQISHSNEILRVAQLLNEHLLEIETGERGYIITGQADFLQPNHHGFSKVFALRDTLLKLLADQPADQEKLVNLNQLIEAKVATSLRNIGARQQSFDLARDQIIEGAGKRQMDKFRFIINELTDGEMNRETALLQQRHELMEEMVRNIVIATFFTLAILLYLHWRLRKAMNRTHGVEQEMLHVATHDALTGLPNRRLMIEYLSCGMQRCQRQKTGLALLFLDLNGFKPINDQHGHLAGDELLQQVGQRLSLLIRASDSVARFGGDEFVVLAEDVLNQEGVCGIVGKIISEIQRPFLLSSGVTVTISTSIGVALYPRDGEGMDVLLRHADTAMYESKRSQSNCFCKEQKHLRRCVLLSDGEEK